MNKEDGELADTRETGGRGGGDKLECLSYKVRIFTSRCKINHPDVASGDLSEC